MPASYFPLDVNFFDHPKVVGRSDGALRLCLAAIGYANRLMTDGFIADRIPGRLVGASDTGTAPSMLAAELVEAVLWHEADAPCPRGHDETCPKLDGEGWRIHDFLEHNRSREERLRSQEQERDRKAAWRQRQKRDAGVPRDTSVPETRDTTVTVTPRRRLTETETETETYQGDGGAVAAPVEIPRASPTGRAENATAANVTPLPTAQTFVAAYVDGYRTRAGHDPPSRVKGQVAKELGRLFAEGIPAEHIKAGLVEWFDRAAHPATLPSFVEVAARNGRARASPGLAQRQVDQARATYERMMADAPEGTGAAGRPGQLELARPADQRPDR